MRVGFIGAGAMGRPIINQLAAAGHDVTVMARSPAARASLEAGDLRYADTVAATVRDADVVFVVVLTDEQVREVSLGPAGALAAMRKGATLVQHTTSDPASVEAIGAEGAARGIHVLDAALSGGPHDIAAARLTLWVGGEASDLERVLPLLDTYASPIIMVGRVGNGQRVKLINNALFVAQVGLAADAVRLAASLEIDEASILDALQHGSGASRGLSVVANAGSVDLIAGRIGRLMQKDVTVVCDTAQRAGADLGIIGTVLSSNVVQKTVLGR
jgi:3-hydroxyisobutyrate dehydrogenase-like beta-hydroxyacid dehydrogenase